MMKNFNLILVLMLLPTVLYAQNPPKCDSVYINSIEFDSLDNSRIKVTVENYSSDIYGYPGWIIFNTNGDTIAKEQVNFFGIGNGPQVHFLQVMMTPTLPFSGYIELHSGFYSQLECTYQASISDTSGPTSIDAISADRELFKVYPNPATTEVLIDFGDRKTDDLLGLIVGNSLGQEVMNVPITGSLQRIALPAELTAGIYFIGLQDQAGRIIANQRLLVR